MSNSVLSLWRY